MSRASKTFLSLTKGMFHVFMADNEHLGNIVEDTPSGKIILECRERLLGMNTRENTALISFGAMSKFSIVSSLEGEFPVSSCIPAIEKVAARIAAAPGSPSADRDIAIISKMTESAIAVSRVWSCIRLSVLRDVIASYGNPADPSFSVDRVRRDLRPVGDKRVSSMMFPVFTEADIIRILRGVRDIERFSLSVEGMLLDEGAAGSARAVSLLRAEMESSKVIMAPVSCGIRSGDVIGDMSRAAATMVCHVANVESDIRSAMESSPDSDFERFIIEETDCSPEPDPTPEENVRKTRLAPGGGGQDASLQDADRNVVMISEARAGRTV